MDKKKENQKKVSPLEVIVVSLCTLVILYEILMTILLALGISLFSVLGIILLIVIFGGGGTPVFYGYYRVFYFFR